MEGDLAEAVAGRAARGEIAHLTGVDSAYEAPDAPDLHLHTDRNSIDACVEEVLALLDARVWTHNLIQ